MQIKLKLNKRKGPDKSEPGFHRKASHCTAKHCTKTLEAEPLGRQESFPELDLVMKCRNINFTRK